MSSRRFYRLYLVTRPRLTSIGQNCPEFYKKKTRDIYFETKIFDIIFLANLECLDHGLDRQRKNLKIKFMSDICLIMRPWMMWKIFLKDTVQLKQ